jgi:hypothetical protein
LTAFSIRWAVRQKAARLLNGQRRCRRGSSGRRPRLLRVRGRAARERSIRGACLDESKVADAAAALWGRAADV